MKKIILSALSFVCVTSYVFAQNNTFPTPSGNVGIGVTSSLTSKLTVNPGGQGGILVGNTAAGSTNLSLGISAATNGFSALQSIKTSGSTPEYGTLTLNPYGGWVAVGSGNLTPRAPFDVYGRTVLNGTAANIDPTVVPDISFLANSSRMLVGWNRMGGAGETDFISNRGAGGMGGFAFYDYRNSGSDPVKPLMWIQGDGNVAIGTLDPRGYKLAVKGSVIAESVTVKMEAQWPDYVFNNQYNLWPLKQVKKFIDENGRLPDMPSAQEIAEKGQDLGEMNRLLTQKVEELTLYLIEKDKELSEQKKIAESQERRIEQVEEAIKILNNKQKDK